MINKITKNLIIFGAIVFSFVFINTTFAYSCIGYSCNNDSFPVNTYNNNNNNQGYSMYPNQGGSQNGYSQYPSTTTNNYTTVNPNTDPNTAVINNYYYPVAPVAPAKTSTASTTTKTTTNTNNTSSTKNTVASNTATKTVTPAKEVETKDVYGNTLGASAANGLTALSFNGSGSFMPSSVWQWMLVIALILIIIILSRMFVHKASPADHDLHTAH